MHYFDEDKLLRFKMRAAQRRMVSKIKAIFHTLWLLWKLVEWRAKKLNGRIEFTLRPNLWHTF